MAKTKTMKSNELIATIAGMLLDGELYDENDTDSGVYHQDPDDATETLQRLIKESRNIMAACKHTLGYRGLLAISEDNKKQILEQFQCDIDEFNSSKKAVPHPGFITWCKYCPKCGEKIPASQHFERLEESEARELILAWLSEKKEWFPDKEVDDLELTLEFQEAGSDGRGDWAFWVDDSDNTSYLHADRLIESYGI